jgi:hypothetical protein
VKQQKSKELGHAHWFATLWVEGHAELQDGTRNNDKQLITHGYVQIKQTSWLVHSLNTFGARTNHGHPRTHKTHHGPNLGDATTFPLIVYFVPFHKPTSK